LSEALEDKVRELLAQSLAAWRLAGDVRRTSDGAILVGGDAGDVHVARAPANLPFRWMVTAQGRRRGAVSLVAVLRQVRAALDPGYAKNPVRIAVSALVPE
jgi:hypothetical protein